MVMKAVATTWPGFESWTRCLMRVEFVVGSRPCSDGFFSGFPFSIESNTPNSILMHVHFIKDRLHRRFLSQQLNATQCNFCRAEVALRFHCDFSAICQCKRQYTSIP